MISVAIPVGPHEANQRWLPECLASLGAQTLKPDEIVLIDDMAGGICYEALKDQLPDGIDVRFWAAPWLLGVAHAFNVGVSLARNEHVIMLGSDDVLQPWALADCWAEWERKRDPLGYYWMDVEYMDTGETQAIQCGAAMVTKSLWRHTGGFPAQAAVGASDTMLTSILLAHHGRAGNLHRVASVKPPYLYRSHAGSDTRLNFSRFEPAIRWVRDTVTREWTPPVWGRS